MRRVLKTFLLWLLIAALPAQGMVVAIQGTCCPPRQAEAAAAMSHLHHETRAMAQHDDHVDHAAVHGHDANAYKAADSYQDQASHQTHQHQTSSCSSCVACYGAIAPPGEIRNPALPGFKAVNLSSCVPIAGHVPASLERPPKPFSI
jgi:hypothetical protein